MFNCLPLILRKADRHQSVLVKLVPLRREEREEGFENLKNSNPGPLVHDRVVEAEDGNVIVIPLSLSALSKYFEIWMKCQILPPLSPDPSGCTSYAPPILQS